MVFAREIDYKIPLKRTLKCHYDDVIITLLASQITSLVVVYSIVYSGVNQRKHQSSASLAFVREIHRGPVNFPNKWPVTRKMFPFDDVIMTHSRCLRGNDYSWVKLTSTYCVRKHLVLYMIAKTNSCAEFILLIIRTNCWTVELPVIWDTITHMWGHCNDIVPASLI